MATGSVSPKAGKIVNIPDQTVTIGTATDGGTGSTASVAFTAGSVITGGPVSYFTATSTPGSLTANGTTSPIIVSGLTSGTTYTFKVKAGNATGFSSAGDSAASNSLTIEAPGSYDSIATTTVGAGGAASITFSSIPSTYTHLQIRYTARSNDVSGGDRIAQKMQFNSDTGANYSHHLLFGTGSAASADAYTSSTFIYTGLSDLPTNIAAANIFGVGVIDILDYKDTNKFKTTRTLSGQDQNSTSGRIFLTSGNWRSTSAISTITLFPETGSYMQYSSIALYGIKGA